jgi:hypothetical protein
MPTGVYVSKNRGPLEKRFWAKIIKGAGESACWDWSGWKNNHGYGMIGGASGESLLAHRVSWEIKHGKITTPKMCVLHRCDNPACSNPDHLFLGTKKQNSQDMARKGRGGSGFIKVTDIHVRIAKRLKERGVPFHKTARLFGLSKQIFSAVRYFKCGPLATGLLDRPTEKEKLVPEAVQS